MDDTLIIMILELDWTNVSSTSNDIGQNGGNIVGVGIVMHTNLPRAAV